MASNDRSAASVRSWLSGWWPPALRRALYSWQQTCNEQEMELATLRGVVLQAQQAVDSFDRRPTEGNVRDVIGLAESLRRYRELRDGKPRPSFPRSHQGVMQRGR